MKVEIAEQIIRNNYKGENVFSNCKKNMRDSLMD